MKYSDFRAIELKVARLEPNFFVQKRFFHKRKKKWKNSYGFWIINKLIKNVTEVRNVHVNENNEKIYFF